MKLLLKRIYLWIATTRFYQFILTWVIPAIRFKRKEYLSDIDYIKIIQALQVGDCLLVKDPFKFSHLLIGGTFSHAGICTDKFNVVYEDGKNDYIYLVGEMGHAGFQEVNLKKFIGYAKHVAIIRPKGVYTFGYGIDMATDARRMGFSSNGYDFSFLFEEKSLYCSELIYHADSEKRYDASTEDLAGLGIPYISPDGLYLAANAEVVLEIEK